MRETSAILRHATARSLVLLDEIGRGTATYDGLSIAWAVAEHIHERVGAKTLFATHYHELCALARTMPRVRNFSVAVREWKEEIVFLRRMVPGAASRSYGIQVARLAGVPRGVIGRAREILGALERGEAPDGTRPSVQQDLFSAPAPAYGPVADALRALDVESLTPLQALNWLADWKSKIAGDGQG
jgi:DNA mismatch repair protein MutS